MFKLLWIVIVLAPSGPTALSVPESAIFQDRPTCESYGDTMTPRMRDWMRGRLGMDWDGPVHVGYRCDAGDAI
jgi:hypothetical protein